MKELNEKEPVVNIIILFFLKRQADVMILKKKSADASNNVIFGPITGKGRFEPNIVCCLFFFFKQKLASLSFSCLVTETTLHAL